MGLGSPRDFEGWIRVIERNQVALRGITAAIPGTVISVINDQYPQISRKPTAPIELTTQTAFYTDTDTRTRVRFLLDFPDVVKATDGSDVTVDGYELWGQDVSTTILDKTSSALPNLALPGATLPGLAATPANLALENRNKKPFARLDTSTDSAFRTDGFTPGSVWTFQARAIAGALAGDFSVPVTVEMLADAVPPPQPTAPVLDVARGVITATWDGLAVTGAMPADFSYAVLAAGPASSPTTEIARFGRNGGFAVAANLPYYTPQFFRLRAYDESGNAGPWSEAAVGYTTPLVDTDIILSTIDGAKTYLKNIDAGVAILPNSIITKNLQVTEEMTAALAQFLHVKAGMLEVNDIWADTAWFGVADAKLVRSDMFIGKAFSGGQFTLTDGGVFQTNIEAYKGIKLTAGGLNAWSASGVATFSLDAVTGNVSIGNGTFTGGMYQSVAAANSGVKLSAAGLKIWDSSNRLVVDANPSSATFTGTVTSGFGAAKAVLADNVFGGRPGIKVVTGSNYYYEPFMISYPQGSTYSGGLHISAAWLGSGSNPGRLWLTDGGEFTLGGYNGTVNTNPDGTGTFGTRSGGRLQLGGTSYLQSSGGAIVQVEANNTATINASAGTTIYGGLNVSGAKNFVMDHPTKPGMELLHGATESPVSGVQYWGCSEIGADGTALVRLPEYFGALVKPGSVCIGVNGNGGVVDWDPGVVDNTFTVRGAPGLGFTWDVKAERVGADFPVERTKVQWTPPEALAE